MSTTVSKLKGKVELDADLTRWRLKGDTIVFTNGCFDLLHPGHLHTFEKAREFGSRLVVGLNADESVKLLKGPERPINDELSRASLLSALTVVDAVVIFEEETPLELIKSIKPEVLVKGGDWPVENIVGAEFVLSYNGRVESVPLLTGYSSTSIIEKIKNL